MDTVTLGRTGLEVSVAGLGCGGHSRLGLSTGGSDDDAVAVVRRALDLGVTFVDTARAYGTEKVVGIAIEGRRDDVVLSTKVMPRGSGGDLLSVDELKRQLDKSFAALRTERVDVLHLHGVTTDVYDHCVDVLVPAMRAMQTEGTVGHLAVSEAFIVDPGHDALRRAVADDCWAVMMVGFNLLNPSARERVLAPAVEREIGVLVMFAVRRALSDPKELRRVVKGLVRAGLVDRGVVDRRDPLGFLADGPAGSVVEAAYRFCRHEPGTHVVLTGTGSIAHLEENIRSICGPPLPADVTSRLDDLFRRVDTISAN